MNEEDIDRLSPADKAKVIDEVRVYLKKYRDLIDQYNDALKDFQDGLKKAKAGETWALDSLKKLGVPEKTCGCGNCHHEQREECDESCQCCATTGRCPCQK